MVKFPHITRRRFVKACAYVVMLVVGDKLRTNTHALPAQEMEQARPYGVGAYGQGSYGGTTQTYLPVIRKEGA